MNTTATATGTAIETTANTPIYSNTFRNNPSTSTVDTSNNNNAAFRTPVTTNIDPTTTQTKPMTGMNVTNHNSTTMQPQSSHPQPQSVKSSSGGLNGKHGTGTGGKKSTKGSSGKKTKKKDVGDAPVFLKSKLDLYKTFF